MSIRAAIGRGGLSVRGPGLNAKSNGKLGEVGAHPVDRRLHGVHTSVQTLLQPVHALIHRVEPMIDPIEPLIDPVEPMIAPVEPGIDPVEPGPELLPDRIEPGIDPVELAPELPSDRIELTLSDPGDDRSEEHTSELQSRGHL